MFEQTLKPKFHLLVHYPTIMRKVGPVRHIWVMRYEGFHKQLKCTAKIVTSRINLLLILCIKQQLKLCYRILSKKGLSGAIKYGHFLGKVHDIKNKKLVSIMKSTKVAFSEEANMFASVKINNIKYNLRNVVQINDTETDCILKFGLLLHIISDKKFIIFILLPITTIAFQDHLQAYEVQIHEDVHWYSVKWEDLPNKFPYNIHIMSNGKSYIVPLQ